MPATLRTRHSGPKNGNRSSLPLTRPRRELFAFALARGKTPAEAALDAGYSAAKKGAALARAPDIIRRSDELRWRLAAGGSRDISGVIDELFDTALASRGLRAAPGMAAAKSCLVEIARLKQLLPFAPGEAPPAAAPAPTGEPFHWTDKEMSDEEWNAHFGPEAPGGKIDYKPGDDQ